MDEKDLLDERVYEQARADERIWESARALGLSRRRLVQLLAASAGAAAVGVVPSRRQMKAAQVIEAIVKPGRSEWFYQIGSNLEMRWETMYNRGYLVPNELFFVRNNNPTPRLDPAT